MSLQRVAECSAESRTKFVIPSVWLGSVSLCPLGPLDAVPEFLCDSISSRHQLRRQGWEGVHVVVVQMVQLGFSNLKSITRPGATNAPEAKTWKASHLSTIHITLSLATNLQAGPYHVTGPVSSEKPRLSCLFRPYSQILSLL